MILFEKRFHQGILSGATTLTFRAWKTARVKPGQRYRCHPIGVLEVDAVSVVSVADISDVDARSAGFASRDEIVAYIAEKTGGDEQHAHAGSVPGAAPHAATPSPRTRSPVRP